MLNDIVWCTIFVREAVRWAWENSGPVGLRGIFASISFLDINDIRVRLELVDTPERVQKGYKEATFCHEFIF